NETPNPKHQAPEKSQTSNQNLSQARCLELGTWSFFGVWYLVFGALIGGRTSPHPGPLPGERENGPPRLDHTRAGVCQITIGKTPISPDSESGFPLPGESMCLAWSLRERTERGVYAAYAWLDT